MFSPNHASTNDRTPSPERRQVEEPLLTEFEKEIARGISTPYHQKAKQYVEFSVPHHNNFEGKKYPRSGVFGQLFSLIKWQALRRIRHPLRLLFVVLLPPFFMFICLFVGMSVKSQIHKPGWFLNYTSDRVRNLLDTPYKMVNKSCYEVGVEPIGDLPKCPAPSSGRNISCLSTDANEHEIPVKGLCIRGIRTEVLDSGILAWPAALAYRTMPILPLDEMIILRWVAAAFNTHATLQQSTLRNGYLLYFSPNNDRMKAFVETLATTTNFTQYCIGGIYGSRNAAINAMRNNPRGWAVIHVNEMSENALDFEVNLRKQMLPSMNKVFYDSYLGGYPKTNAELDIISGLATLQRTVNEYYLENVINKPKPPTPVITPMGYPAYESRETRDVVINNMIPYVAVLSQALIASILTWELVYEKQKQIRRTLILSGVTLGVQCTAWWFVNLISAAISAGLIAVLFNLFPNLVKLSIKWIFVFFFFYGCSIIALVRIIAAIFEEAAIAMISTLSVIIILSLPLFSIYFARGVFLYFCLLFSIFPLATAFQKGNPPILFEMLGREHPLILYEPSVSPETVSLVTALVFLIIDIIIYVLISIWFDHIMPSKNRPNIAWYCCLTAPFDWFREKRRPQKLNTVNELERDDELMYDNRDPNGLYEEEMYPTSVIRADDHVLVRGVTAHPQRNEQQIPIEGFQCILSPGTINAFVAGSEGRLLLQMLVGEVRPKWGDTFVFGNSIAFAPGTARRWIGFSPQMDNLYPDLTCAEHLKLYAELKGMRGNERDEEVQNILQSAKLEEVADHFPSQLYSGQKRELSVATAFTSPSNRFIVLEDPSVDVDAFCRHRIWDFVKAQSANRCIVLLSQRVEDVEEVSSNVSLICNGRLRYRGSPIFIRALLGAGYVLRLHLSDPKYCDEYEDTIKQYVRSAHCVKHQDSNELIVHLSVASMSQFPVLLERLEMYEQESRGVLGISVFCTGFEEALAYMATQESPALDAQNEEASHPYTHGDHTNDAAQNFVRVAQRSSETKFGIIMHIKGLLYKRVLTTIRDYTALVRLLIIPLMGVVLIILFSHYQAEQSDSITLSPAIYPKETEILVSDACSKYFNVNQPFSKTEIPVIVPNLADGTDLYYKLFSEFSSHKNPRLMAMFCDDTNVTELMTTVSPPFVNIFSNFTMYHQIAMSVHTFYSEYIKFVYSDRGNSVTTVNTVSGSVKGSGTDVLLWSLLYAIYLFIPYALITTVFVVWPVSERRNNTKKLQILSGVNFFTYWLINFIYDYFTFTIISLVIILLLYFFDKSTLFLAKGSVLAVLALFLLYGTAGILLSYSLSNFFKRRYLAQAAIFAINFYFCFIAVSATYLCTLYSSLEYKMSIARAVLRIVPAFAFGDGIFNAINLFVNAAERHEEPNIFGFKQYECGRDLFYLIIESAVLLIFVLFWDSPPRRHLGRSFMQRREKRKQRREKKSKSVTQDTSEKTDDRNRNPNATPDKAENKGRRMSLGRFTFCTGEDGVSFISADRMGKTTMAAVMNRRRVGSGEGSLAPVSSLQDIGYCPQKNALFPLLTLEENLKFFCTIRGLKSDYSQQVIEALFTLFSLEPYRKVLARHLDLTRRRLLSVAIAFMGHPKLIILDDPTKYMDPFSRWDFWNKMRIINKLSCMAFTTDNFCGLQAMPDSNVAILNKGEVKYVGSNAYIENIDNGFYLQLNLKQNANEELLHEHVRQVIPSARLVGAHEYWYSFELPKNVLLSATFRAVEDLKKIIPIAYYSVWQKDTASTFLCISTEESERDVRIFEQRSEKKLWLGRFF